MRKIWNYWRSYELLRTVRFDYKKYAAKPNKGKTDENKMQMLTH